MELIQSIVEIVTSMSLVIIAGCQVWLVYQQNQFLKWLAAKNLKITPENLEQQMKTKPPTTRHFCDPTPSEQESFSDPEDPHIPS